MVRIIMAAVGILFICIGGPGIGLGLLLLSPAVVTIIMKILKTLNENKRRKDAKEAYAERVRAENQARAERKENAVEQQNKLREQYKNSPLTKEVINSICNGDSYARTPEKIVITDNWIQGIRQGQTFTYDFGANRVQAFSHVIRTVEKEEELKYVVRPQIAMAEALNSLLGNSFKICDNAKRNINFRTDIDGDSYTTITYISDHVTMVLKSTLPNKQF